MTEAVFPQPDDQEVSELYFEPELAPVAEIFGEAAVDVPSPNEVATGGIRRFARKHKKALVIGAFMASGVWGVANHSDEAVNALVSKNGAATVAGVIAAEGVWIGGAAAAVGALGVGAFSSLNTEGMSRKKQLWGIAKRHDLKGEIAPLLTDAAIGNKAFNTAIVVNTVAAVAEFAIPTVAVVSQLKPESWGILAPSSFDLMLTYTVRKFIYDWVHNARLAKEAEAGQ